jgi:hypothetical protein
VNKTRYSSKSQGVQQCIRVRCELKSQWFVTRHMVTNGTVSDWNKNREVESSFHKPEFLSFIYWSLITIFAGDFGLKFWR